ncbi:MAG: hypothetical protein ACREFB_01530 [Stellaceae bacterium]
MTRKAKVALRDVPEGVVCDIETAIGLGRDCIYRALAGNEWDRQQGGTPTPSGARAYKLATRLKDEGLSPEKIVDLLIEMVPWFDKEDRPQIEAMVESAFLRGQNDPGCGPPDSAMRLFAEDVAQWEATTEESKELRDRMLEASQGAVQRLPDRPPTEFPPGFTEEVRRIIADDQAELARRLK